MLPRSLPLPAEAAEHDLVIKQLEPMDKGRKCYRLIGDVLVERTVAETLPAGGLGGSRVWCMHEGGVTGWSKYIHMYVSIMPCHLVHRGEVKEHNCHILTR